MTTPVGLSRGEPGVTGPIGFAADRRPILIMARVRNDRFVRIEE